MKIKTAFSVLLGMLLCESLSAQDIIWEKSLGGKHSDYLFDAVATADYGFILAGSSLSKKTGNKTVESQGGLDYWIWKMDEHGEPEWQKSYGGSGTDLLHCIKLTNDGGFFLAGTSDSPAGLQKKDGSRGQHDIWVIKLDANGSEQWQRTIGGSGQEQLVSAFPTSDGGYILGGSSSSQKSTDASEPLDPFGKWDDGFGNLDYWAIKLDSKGNIEWQRTIGGLYADQLRSVIQTRDSGFVLSGYSNSPESGNKTAKSYGEGDFYVVRLDREGNIVWQRCYGGDGDDQPHSLLETADGNLIIAGNSTTGNTGNKNASNRNGTDFWMLKLDLSGEIIWQRTYDTFNLMDKAHFGITMRRLICRTICID